LVALDVVVVVVVADLDLDREDDVVSALNLLVLAAPRGLS